MPGLPAVINVAGKRAVIVGGGSVACRRAAALREAGACVVVVAPEVRGDVRDLAGEVHERRFEPRDLEGAWIAVIATDNPGVNDAVAAEARHRGVLVNRTDRPEAGDFVVPAHRRTGPVTLAVDTGGISASGAAAIRDAAGAGIDPTWPRLLELARPWRARIKARFPDDPRRRARLLQALTDARSMTILEHRGEAALTAWWQAMLDDQA